MQNIMNQLYDQYCRPAPRMAIQKEIEEAHQALIRSLEKPERKLVLRIIDSKDLVSDARARKRFEYGFRLAWRLLTQLNTTVGKILEEVYPGHTINLKYTTLSYKNKKRVKCPKSERVRIENTHEPLIDQPLGILCRISASTSAVRPKWRNRISSPD